MQTRDVKQNKDNKIEDYSISQLSESCIRIPFLEQSVVAGIAQKIVLQKQLTITTKLSSLHLKSEYPNLNLATQYKKRIRQNLENKSSASTSTRGKMEDGKRQCATGSSTNFYQRFSRSK